MGYRRLLATLALGWVWASGASAAEAGPVRVIAYAVEPYFYQANGKPAGLEYDILEYLAKASGRTLQIEWVERFEDVLPRLERGEGDVAAATITITDARRERFAFSVPYIPVRVILVEAAGRTSTSLADLKGTTLATIKGTTYEALLSAVPEAELLYAGSEREQFELVASGKAQALAVDSAVAFHMVSRYPGLKLGIALTPEQGFGFAFPKGSPLAATFSGYLERLKGSNIFYPLVQKHLGKEAVQAIKSARND